MVFGEHKFASNKQWYNNMNSVCAASRQFRARPMVCPLLIPSVDLERSVQKNYEKYQNKCILCVLIHLFLKPQRGKDEVLTRVVHAERILCRSLSWWARSKSYHLSWTKDIWVSTSYVTILGCYGPYFCMVYISLFHCLSFQRQFTKIILWLATQAII